MTVKPTSGHWYEMRNGATAQYVGKNHYSLTRDAYPHIVGDNVYTDDGNMWRDLRESAFDLMKDLGMISSRQPENIRVWQHKFKADCDARA